MLRFWFRPSIGWGELPDALTCLPSAARGKPATAITLTALVSLSFPVK